MCAEIARNNALKDHVEALQIFLASHEYDTESLQYDVFADVYKEDKDKSDEKCEIIHVGNRIGIEVSFDGHCKNTFRDATNMNNQYSNIAIYVNNEELVSTIKSYIINTKRMHVFTIYFSS